MPVLLWLNRKDAEFASKAGTCALTDVKAQI